MIVPLKYTYNMSFFSSVCNTNIRTFLQIGFGIRYVIVQVSKRVYI